MSATPLGTSLVPVQQDDVKSVHGNYKTCFFFEGDKISQLWNAPGYSVYSRMTGEGNIYNNNSTSSMNNEPVGTYFRRASNSTMLGRITFLLLLLLCRMSGLYCPPPSLSVCFLLSFPFFRLFFQAPGQYLVIYIFLHRPDFSVLVVPGTLTLHAFAFLCSFATMLVSLFHSL